MAILPFRRDQEQQQETAQDLRRIIEHVVTHTGRLGIEIVDIGGNVAEVNDRVESEAARFEQLRGVAEQMSAAARVVDAAARNAQHVAGAASADMTRSEETVAESVARIRTLAGSVKDIEERLSGLNKTLGRVTKVAKGIGAIAKQTNLLALNATIEAARAGEGGQGFANVAEEIKELASQTSEATANIDNTLRRLSEQTEELIEVGARGSTRAERVRQEAHGIQEVMKTLARGMQDVDTESSRIAEAVQTIDRHSQRTAEGLHEVSSDAQASAENLATANERIARLLEFTEKLMNIGNSGDVETEDAPYIRKAMETAAKVSRAFEEALANGEISEADLFDRDYQPIPGTNPQQFRTRNLELTDRVCPPIHEPVWESDDKIIACCPCDYNGYIGTHSAVVSKPQRRNDPAWNKANCRNRMMYDDRVGLGAARNTKPFLLQAYRRNMGNGKFVLTKDVSAPIYVNGKHWGALRLVYQP